MGMVSGCPNDLSLTKLNRTVTWDKNIAPKAPNARRCNTNPAAVAAVEMRALAATTLTSGKELCAATAASAAVAAALEERSEQREGTLVPT